MAKRIDFPKVDEYITKLETWGARSEAIINKAVAAGAKPVADQCKANIKALPRVTDKWALVLHNRYVAAMKAGKKEEAEKIKMKLSDTQKESLTKSMGLAPIRNDNGYVNTKLGFDGYNNVITRRWPKGQPNAMIARSVESGSTTIDKHPFVRPAIIAKKAAAEKAMQETLDNEIFKIMK